MRRLICLLFQDQKSDTSPSVDKLKSQETQITSKALFWNHLEAWVVDLLQFQRASPLRLEKLQLLTARSVMGTVMPKNHFELLTMTSRI